MGLYSAGCSCAGCGKCSRDFGGSRAYSSPKLPWTYQVVAPAGSKAKVKKTKAKKADKSTAALVRKLRAVLAELELREESRG